MPLTGSPDRGVDPAPRAEDDEQMRFPRASAVVVALSTFVAVATVAALASQLVPFDRAGAILPDGPITTEGQPAHPDPTEEPTPGTDEGPTGDSGTTTPGSGQNSAGDSATVVDPAPPETVNPEPEPEPEPTGPPESPGNSGNAPGQNGTPGNNGDTTGGGKP
jgi:hypothetical protein